MEQRRVAITGRGVTLPDALNVDKMMENLYTGKSPIENVSYRFPWLKDYRSQCGSLFKESNFEYQKFGIDVKESRRIGQSAVYALEAANQAIKESGFLDGNSDEIRENTGVIVGHGLCGIIEIEEQKVKQLEKGISRVSPNVCIKSLPDSAAGYISLIFKLHGESYSVATACASGATAIRKGYESIKHGDSLINICGGTVESAAPLIYASFGQLGAMSKRNNDPTHASRPFDLERDGFVLGEGAGIVVLEELEHAKKRGANILGELVGCAFSSDGHEVTAPRPDAKYITRAMNDAIAKAGINKEQIGYINPHGTSTPDGDIVETLGIKNVFLEYAKNIPISSTKSMLGHMLSAAGGVEFIVALESVRRGIIHPTINIENPDPECDLDYVPNQAREQKIEYAMSNSFGFLGRNESLIVTGF